MLARDKIQEEIAAMPEELLEEVMDFIGYLKVTKLNERFDNLVLASEGVLSKDWMTEVEDEAWMSL